MCNKLAKKKGGVCNWQELNQDEELANYPVGDIWGVGYSKTAFLKKHGINTALDLKNYPLHKAKKNLTINGFRTVQELNGIPAMEKTEAKPRQTVAVSRSFQSAVFALDDIKTALAEYTQEAVKRIRAENLSCRYVSVYLMTNAWAQGDQYYNQMSAELPRLSANLAEITATANLLLERIYRPNYKYRKVMIGLTGLDKASNPQPDLFDVTHNQNKHSELLMHAFDSITSKYGRGTIKLACGLDKKPTSIEPSSWKVKRDYLSPCYTTKIDEIPIVY